MLAVRMRAGHEGGSCRERERAGVGGWERALPEMLLKYGFSPSSQTSYPLPDLDEKVRAKSLQYFFSSTMNLKMELLCKAVSDCSVNRLSTITSWLFEL